jgi:MFS transporter, CP family, cyanate transporter
LPTKSGDRRVAAVFAAIIFAGLNLRIAVASVPPLLDDLHVSSAVAGTLTSIPLICFGVGALAAPVVGRRLGGEAALVAALLLVALGTSVRALPSTPALFTGTVFAGIGIAVGNVVVPAVIRGRAPEFLGPLMGLYTASLNIGAAAGGGIAVPLEHAFGVRGSLAAWTVPAVAAALVAAVVFALDRERHAGMRGAPAAGLTLLRSRLAWWVTLFFGVQSALFYSGLTWLPSILHDAGYSHSTAGALLAVYALVGVPPALFAPVLAARARDQRLLLVVFAGLELLAVFGLLVARGVAPLWVVVYAIGQGGSFALALTLVVLRAPNPRRVAELSAMAQAGGYALAALGPLVAGLLHAATGGWTAPLVFLLSLGVPIMVAASIAGKPRYV